MSTRRYALAASGGLLLSVVALGLRSPVLAVTTSDFAIADGQRFRSDFGLESDLQLVRASFSDPTYSSDEFGVDGIVVTYVGIDVAGNQVAVGVQGLTAESSSKLSARFPTAPIVIRDQAPLANDTCSSMSYCWPMKGGIRQYVTTDHSDI